MWFADICCDIEWVSARKGLLGAPRFTIRGARSESLGIKIEIRLFGDELALRHVRVLMSTEDQRIAQTCLNLNIQTWVAALETAVMLGTKRPFQVAEIPGSHMCCVVLGQGEEDSPACTVVRNEPSNLPVDYREIAQALAAWGGQTGQYLFYFRRFVDGRMPLDVRWLNGYRLLEWNFVRERANLPRDIEWKQFVSRFESRLLPFCRPGQKPIGLLEEARALAAHAGLDERSDSERAARSENAMEATFRVLELMVTTVLNELPSMHGLGIKWQVSSG